VAFTVTPLLAETKVFLMGGQSNMAGVGGYPGEPSYPADLPCPPPYNQIQTGVKFWNYGPNSANGAGVHSPGVGTGWVNLQPGFGYTNQEYGPELSFGYSLHEMYPDDEIYLVKLGVSGATLAINWNPNGTGASYNLFKSRVNTAMNNLIAAGKSPEIAGMVWMQGETDATNHAYALAYETNLTNLITKVRSDFAAPEMEFVMGRITTHFGSPTDNALVRSAQDDIPSQIANTDTFTTDDLQLAYVGHYGTQGQIDLGNRFASYFAPAPEPSSAMLGICALLSQFVLCGRWR
jgi:hypothetical protein